MELEDKLDYVQLLMLTQKLREEAESYIRNEGEIGAACAFLVSVLEVFEEVLQGVIGET